MRGGVGQAYYMAYRRSPRGREAEVLPDQPTWKMLAEVLVMATGYE
jgi:hypothetical protein